MRQLFINSDHKVSWWEERPGRRNSSYISRDWASAATPMHHSHRGPWIRSDQEYKETREKSCACDCLFPWSKKWLPDWIHFWVFCLNYEASQVAAWEKYLLRKTFVLWIVILIISWQRSNLGKQPMLIITWNHKPPTLSSVWKRYVCYSGYVLESREKKHIRETFPFISTESHV